MQDDATPTVSPALVQFLANRVLEVIATQSHQRLPWTRRRIASYISRCTKIEGTISDATLGRFLDPHHPQRPTYEKVMTVQAFLLYFSYITKAQLDWVEESLSIRSGLALDMFFAVPETAARANFLAELEGEYRALSGGAPFLLVARLHLTRLPEIEMLAATEVMSLYRKTGQSGFSPQTIKGQGLEDGLIARFTATGQVFASADLMAVFLKAAGGGFDSILAVTEIGFGDDDLPHILSGTRNSGWQERAGAQWAAVEALKPDAQPRQATRLLANDPQFYRYVPDENLAPPDADPARSAGAKHFLETARLRGELYDEVIRKLWAEAANADERLQIAFEYSSLPHFAQALADGADPNGHPKDFDDPYVLLFAKNGDLAWAQILLADPRCRMVLDANGMTPSFHTGMLLQHIKGAKGADDLRAEWAALYELLLARETEQGCQMQPGGIPSPS